MSEPKKTKDYRKLYLKYKRRARKANEELLDVLDQRDLLKHQVDSVQRQFETAEAQRVAAQTRLNRMEHESAMKVRKEMDLQYFEVDGSKPILWINTTDPRLANAATFGNIRDRLSRSAPGIEMIIFTYGDVKIWEMEPKDLEKIGLCRIEGHGGGTFGTNDPKRLTDGQQNR